MQKLILTLTALAGLTTGGFAQTQTHSNYAGEEDPKQNQQTKQQKIAYLQQYIQSVQATIPGLQNTVAYLIRTHSSQDEINVYQAAIEGARQDIANAQAKVQQLK
jgi:peptidoglycan hydrolase CwlO-like protein